MFAEVTYGSKVVIQKVQGSISQVQKCPTGEAVVI